MFLFITDSFKRIVTQEKHREEIGQFLKDSTELFEVGVSNEPEIENILSP
jgi:hypothetical protein